jgi:hypothetical protein
VQQCLGLLLRGRELHFGGQLHFLYGVLKRQCLLGSKCYNQYFSASPEKKQSLLEAHRLKGGGIRPGGLS